MDKKILVGSVLVIVVIILASISPVIGYKISDKKNVISSPLFSARKNKILSRDIKKVNSKYIGHGNALNLFIKKRTTLQDVVDKATKIVNVRPDVIDEAFNKIISMPEVINLLNENNIDVEYLKNQVDAIEKDPKLLEETINKAALSLPLDSNNPIPVGLSTSNPIGCVIVIISLLPVFIILGVMIATMTLVTCLNLNGCFETLMQNLIDGLTQGFTPSGMYI